MKDFSWIPKFLCVFPVPGTDWNGKVREWGGKINIAKGNNTIMSVSPPLNEGVKFVFHTRSHLASTSSHLNSEG